jgi:hypothetical protein
MAHYEECVSTGPDIAINTEIVDFSSEEYEF